MNSEEKLTRQILHAGSISRSVKTPGMWSVNRGRITGPNRPISPLFVNRPPLSKGRGGMSSVPEKIINLPKEARQIFFDAS